MQLFLKMQCKLWEHTLSTVCTSLPPPPIKPECSVSWIVTILNMKNPIICMPIHTTALYHLLSKEVHDLFFFFGQYYANLSHHKFEWGSRKKHDTSVLAYFSCMFTPINYCNKHKEEDNICYCFQLDKTKMPENTWKTNAICFIKACSCEQKSPN